MKGIWLDTTKGATHYMTEELFRHHPPSWVATMRPTVTVGRHVFLKSH